MKEWLRFIPAIHELKSNKSFQHILEHSGLDDLELTKQLRFLVDTIREQLLNESWSGAHPSSGAFIDELFGLLEKNVTQQYAYTLKRVINATGTILHTNLGRARLSQNAIFHMIDTARHYSNLEYKLEEGERGSRHSHIEVLLKVLTGAESAMVVNNNAAAVYLILRALAKDKEVIVSRGQLVEIGGSFRISSIMEESGATLVEVGTTNKTHLFDYENAINEHTKMILKVHTSNFKTIGFTKTVESEELVNLSSQHENIIFYEDLGSGVLYDFTQHRIGDEPVVKRIVELGADLVSFSGDKLLGGPQAGIIVGKKELVEKLKKHQLARVLRVDKMTLAALEGTLLDYLKGENGRMNIPTLRDMLWCKEEIKSRATDLIKKLLEMAPEYEVALMESTSQVGGGTMPDVELPTVVLTIKHPRVSSAALAKKLRVDCQPAIVTRVQNDELLIDLRTVEPEEEELILNALQIVGNSII
ncbi:L-seryl-tRNA(Sec) selenium transferase [Neobacillus sp. D3-1R]|uniref:L-seryl-tRNA(Sec) selenium transferase n=1 Tax=Neobacillus sp. D3-1R TaxID=3445778 RepID=UPI003F9ED27D